MQTKSKIQQCKSINPCSTEFCVLHHYLLQKKRVNLEGEISTALSEIGSIKKFDAANLIEKNVSCFFVIDRVR